MHYNFDVRKALIFGVLFCVIVSFLVLCLCLYIGITYGPVKLVEAKNTQWTVTYQYYEARPRTSPYRGTVIIFPANLVDASQYSDLGASLASKTNNKVFILRPRFRLAAFTPRLRDLPSLDTNRPLIVIGHSAGAGAACRHVAQDKQPAVRQLIVVAGYCRKTMSVPIVEYQGSLDQMIRVKSRSKRGVTDKDIQNSGHFFITNRQLSSRGHKAAITAIEKALDETGNRP